MTNRFRPSPAELTERWPDLRSQDPDAEVARQFVLNLREGLGEDSVRSVARNAELSEGTIRTIIAGAVWPDLRTIARLERALGRPLYPR